MPLSPLVVLHGITGSSLYATYTNAAPFYFCPKRADRLMVWQNNTFLGKLSVCAYDLLKVGYDKVRDKFFSKPFVKIEADNNSMVETRKFLEERGYVLNDNLFVMAYDWRIAPWGLEEKFYPDLKAQVEERYNRDGNKTSLLGYSLGSHVVHYFLTRYCGENWTLKYIDKVCLMAPAMAGAAQAVGALLRPDQIMSSLPYNDLFRDFIKSLPGLFILLPNQAYTKELFIMRDDVKLNATAIPLLLDQYKLLNEDQLEAFRKSLIITANPLQHLKVPTFVYYNSGVSTITGFNLTATSPAYNGNGDGTVPSAPLDAVCEQWTNQFPNLTKCLDAGSNETTFNHGGFEKNKEVSDAFFDFINP